MSTLYPRTFRVGSTSSFGWAATEPVQADLGVALTIGGFAAAMAQGVADVGIAAGGVNTDRTVLTASIAPVIPDNFLRFGDAFLITAEGYSVPVRVLRVDGTAILLSNPLPLDAALTGPSTLQFAAWFATIGPANVTAAVDYQGAEWSIAYTPHATLNLAYAQGLVKVVRVIWQTGLDTALLIRTFPQFQNVDHRNPSYQPIIDAAAQELAMRIDTDVASFVTTSGERATIDDVQSQNSALLQVHLYLTAARVSYNRSDFLASEGHITKAFGTESNVDLRRKTGLYADAMRPIWIDLDRDGVVDDGEVETITGPGPGFTSGGFSSTPRVTVARQR
ncbi:MAG: hypothetical protein COA38_20580 [Fluviicola sp.]|nr:MAG: hypothetical protein COA38_20580 [Fluviicola sp.]